MTRYVVVGGYGRYPFPDDDPRTDDEIRATVIVLLDAEFARLKVIRDAADAARVAATETARAAVRAAAPRVITTGPTIGAIGGGEANATLIGQRSTT